MPPPISTPGEYQLLVYQQDGKKHPVEFKILPNPPKIANLPIIVNQGAAPQHFVLKGERLGLITETGSFRRRAQPQPAGSEPDRTQPDGSS